VEKIRPASFSYCKGNAVKIPASDASREGVKGRGSGWNPYAV